MKRLYVGAVRTLRAFLAATGGLSLLDRMARRSRQAMWVRSLLAIYDLDDLVGLDTPWWTFDSIDVVEGHLAARPEARVFEWGSGASTAWLAARAARVIAVEHDPAWADQVRPLLPATVEVRTMPPGPADAEDAVRSRKSGFEGLDFGAYVHAIEQTEGGFDLIVIDGRAREACLAPALEHLADEGLIVFDNVDRQRYRDAIVQVSGVDVRWTRGLTPCLPYPTRTALIRRSRST